jgi:hypothetical protein
MRKRYWFISSIVCLISILTVGGEGSPPPQNPKMPARTFSLACRISFTRFARLYLIKESPLTILYEQQFRTNSAFDQTGRKGRVLMCFEKGQLVLQGMGLEEKSTPEILQEDEKGRPFQPLQEWNGMIGTDMFPISRNVTVSKQADFLRGLGSLDLSVAIAGHKTHVEIRESPSKREPGKVLGSFDYEDDFQCPPWVATWDLDGDGIEEVVIGQQAYALSSLFVMSRTPANFKALEALIKGISEFGNWPASGAEIFQKGQVTKIPLSEKPSP